MAVLSGFSLHGTHSDKNVHAKLRAFGFSFAWASPALIFGQCNQLSMDGSETDCSMVRCSDKDRRRRTKTAISMQAFEASPAEKSMHHYESFVSLLFCGQSLWSGHFRSFRNRVIGHAGRLYSGGRVPPWFWDVRQSSDTDMYKQTWDPCNRQNTGSNSHQNSSTSYWSQQNMHCDHPRSLSRFTNNKWTVHVGLTASCVISASKEWRLCLFLGFRLRGEGWGRKVTSFEKRNVTLSCRNYMVIF